MYGYNPRTPVAETGGWCISDRKVDSEPAYEIKQNETLEGRKTEKEKKTWFIY